MAPKKRTIFVDYDSMDLTDASEISQSRSDPTPFQDMTSNQAITHFEISKPSRKEVLVSAVDEASGRKVEQEELADYAIDLITVSLAKSLLPYLRGRVHVQVSPRHAYDTDRTVEHALNLVRIFEEKGVTRERVCVKIPATWPSILACQKLESQGIRTLATCVFSLAQAQAASQAGCLYVAPYVNELRVHFEPERWKKYVNPAAQHPSSPVIASIVKEFRIGGSNTLIMPASFVEPEEVLGITSLASDYGGVDHLTLPPSIIKSLVSSGQTLPLEFDSFEDPQSLSQASLARDKQDHISSLQKAISDDPETSRKLKDALELFGEFEGRTRKLISDFLNA